MATSVPQGSAQIFTFPPRGRYAVGDANPAQNRPAKLTTPQAVIVGTSGAWYHDEAVQDAERVRKKI